MPAHPVILILGSGPRVGAAVAKQFASTGYSVAIASRSASAGKTTEGYLSVKADLSNPSSISAVFDAVKAEFQSPPSVVVYNAAALTPPADDTLFSIPADSVAADLNVNTVSAYAAAQEAVKGWEGLPQNTNKLFIFTGNMQNKAVIPMPLMLNLGIGKSASAFIYADERNADGSMKGMSLDGEAHAQFFADLANGKEEVPWHATFVKGKGYVTF
ncbi:hypothetical protein PENSOL_c010G09277 [Penicillium solitum]|uniref:NAD(P)-binding domain-containing protein n=1 Tax=Penicillium solitum TaxID=60172 RepID=A0A1V6R925_9EURO|nr:uncharacterized protein PENSOL_c010G09277 [Penicillium solitum]OQD97929.1 hypothetical protein PENSOL_c010G09277 [Penicillium solitum]